MIVRLYSCFDSASLSFGMPIPAASDAVMKRMMQALVETTPDAPQVKYAADHTVYFIGEFNDETGELARAATPGAVLRFADMIEVK